MNKFLDLHLMRFVPVGLIALAAAVLLAPATASANAYVVRLVQQGSNVVATGGGSIDLTGLTGAGPGAGGSGGFIYASSAYIAIGSGSGEDDYSGFTGPTSFGTGSGFTTTTNGNGDLVGIAGSNAAIGEVVLFVPSGYVSDHTLSDTATWDGASFASLGVNTGTYTWIWGSEPDQRFTLIIGNGVAVPEPAAFGMFGLGLLLIGGFVGLRRRVA